MNVLYQILNLPVFAPADDAGAAIAEPAPGPDEDASEGGESSPESEASEGAPEGEDSGKPSGEPGKEDGGEGESTPEPLAITAEGDLEAYADDINAFNDDLSAYMADNPDASTKDVLQEAAKRQARLTQQAEAAAEKAFTDQITSWDKEVRADPDMGGANFDATVASAKLAIDKFGGDKKPVLDAQGKEVLGDDGKPVHQSEIQQVLETSGLGSHPAIVRFFAKVGDVVKDAPVLGAGSAGGDGSDGLKTRYNNSTP